MDACARVITGVNTDGNGTIINNKKGKLDSDKRKGAKEGLQAFHDTILNRFHQLFALDMIIAPLII